MHPSSLDFNKNRFGERCHVHLRGHKKTLWTPTQAMEKLRKCCRDSDTEESDEDCGDQMETSFIQVRRTENLRHTMSIFFRIQEIRTIAMLPVWSLCQMRQRTPLRIN